MTHDVLIAGAGPAGCVAAIVLARAGARVRLLDRATFPRDKLCGDTLNPGALGVLRRLGLTVADEALPIAGMLVTGPNGARVDAVYPGGVTGRAIVRRALDERLLRSAAAAGVDVDDGVLVRRVLLDTVRQRVAGLVVRGRSGGDLPIHARVVVGADGRESRLARGLGLAGHPTRPRRWAVGAYFTGVREMSDRGEMHVRVGHYIGVAPVPGGLVNVCVVTADRERLKHPHLLIADAIARDPVLGERFSRAVLASRPVVLGPLAVECRVPGMPGLLLAGDAAGFIDPMTGDGLRFALRGAELAASEAQRMLQTGDDRGHLRLAAATRREFSGKWRFNRALRRLTASAPAVHLAGLATRVSGWPLNRLIRFAGDLSAA
jgi:flavin-dependent dehydrogenase